MQERHRVTAFSLGFTDETLTIDLTLSTNEAEGDYR